MALPLGLMLAPSIAQMGMGAFQGLQSALMTFKRPKYEIPQEIKDMYSGAKGMASQTRMPGQDEAEANLGESTANYASMIERTTGGSGSSIGGLAKLYANEIKAKRGLNTQAQMWRDRNQEKLTRVQQIMADQKMKQWDYNINQPYQKNVAAKSALGGASISNMMSGGSSMFGTLAYDKMVGSGLAPKIGGDNTLGSNNEMNASANQTNYSLVPKIGEMKFVTPESLYQDEIKLQNKSYWNY